MNPESIDFGNLTVTDLIELAHQKRGKIVIVDDKPQEYHNICNKLNFKYIDSDDLSSADAVEKSVSGALQERNLLCKTRWEYRDIVYMQIKNYLQKLPYYGSVLMVCDGKTELSISRKIAANLN